jgi:hypothetical protein
MMLGTLLVVMGSWAVVGLRRRRDARCGKVVHRK